MSKTQEITKLLKSGLTPTQVIARGHKRGMVYRVNKALRTNPQDNGNNSKILTHTTSSETDTSIESDPEIMELKKSLRKAALEKEIIEIRMPKDVESRLTALEESSLKLGEKAGFLSMDIDDLKKELGATPLYNLRSRFKCECGKVGMLAVKVHCTVCKKETEYGSYPKK